MFKLPYNLLGGAATAMAMMAGDLLRPHPTDLVGGFRKKKATREGRRGSYQERRARRAPRSDLAIAVEAMTNWQRTLYARSIGPRANRGRRVSDPKRKLRLALEALATTKFIGGRVWPTNEDGSVDVSGPIERLTKRGVSRDKLMWALRG